MPSLGPTRIACWQLVALALGTNDKLVALVDEHLMRRPEQRSHPWIERCRRQTEGAVAVLDHAAADTDPRLLAGRLSQADVTIATLLGFLGLVEAATGVSPPDEGHFPHLARLSDRCEAEAAFAARSPPEGERPLPPGFTRA